MRRVFRDDHELFRDQVRRFIAQEIAPHYAAWETAGVTPASLWRRAGEEGLLNCALPEPYGLGGDFGHAAVVIEELARANYLGIGFSIHSDMVAPYVDAFGTEAQKARWLPAMTRGELIGALALTEPGAGSDLKAIRSRAVRDGDHYVLNGQKTFITNGVNAGLAIVLASTAPDLARAACRYSASRPDCPATPRARRWTRSASTARTPASCSSTTCACPPTACWDKKTRPSNT